jgi:hypothetical protein
MASLKNKTHIKYWICFGLLLSFLLSLAGSFFPHQSFTQTLLYKIDGLFATCAFACLVSKAASEGYDLAAAGFTILAISQGLFLAHIDEPGHWKDESATTAVFFMIPSFIMITYYAKFPKWLHVAGIISTVPFLTLIVMNNIENYKPGPVIKNTVYLTYQFITLCWAWYTWNDRKAKS